MTLWVLPLLPVLAGAGLWAAGARLRPALRPAVLGAGGVAVLTAAAAIAWWAYATDAAATYAIGAGLVLEISAGPVAGPAAILVTTIAAVVVAYAAVHEPAATLARLIGLLVAFVGVMLLLVLADDLLTLTAAWELVGGLSWALIGHDWRTASAPRAAAHAFNATRFGGLGLFLAAGAVLAGTGSLRLDALGRLDGVGLSVAAAGILLAAASKSAQVPFSPWLFSAMAGPTPVSALLHSSTMVAAGAYLLIRVQPALGGLAWFGPTTIAVGLATALAGGLVAGVQSHAKKLLAASTSAQYGLMFVAIGAGYPIVAALHLAAHAVFKSQLFLGAGVAIEARESPRLADMRLGGALPATAALMAVGSVALAAVPPLGAAFTKEQVLAAASEQAVWLGLLVVVAGALSAGYAARFHLLAFGRDDDPARPLHRAPRAIEVGALGLLAAASIGLGALWLPGVSERAASALAGRLPAAKAWELLVSLLLVGGAVWGVWAADRAGRLAAVAGGRLSAVVADWIGLPALTRRIVVAPTLAVSSALARFDDRVVDATVEAVAAGGKGLSRLLARPAEHTVDAAVHAVWVAGQALADGGARWGERVVDGTVEGTARLVGRAGDQARRPQTGLVHHQYVVIALGLGLVIVAAVLGR